MLLKQESGLFLRIRRGHLLGTLWYFGSKFDHITCTHTLFDGISMLHGLGLGVNDISEWKADRAMHVTTTNLWVRLWSSPIITPLRTSVHHLLKYRFNNLHTYNVILLMRDMHKGKVPS